MNPTLLKVSDYKETAGGTHYRVGTPDEVIAVLERARLNRQRLAIVYRAESAPVFGRIGRSCGPTLKVPLVLHNTRSSGGEPVSTTIIEQIRTSDGSQILYQAS